jgi:NADH-quinone oxidoreductase subunit K
MIVPIHHVLTFSLALFLVGVVGVLSRRNGIIVLMSVELMLNAANINFIAFSRLMSDIAGQVFAVFVIVTAAGEVAVGLAIIISLFRGTESINVDEITLLKG